MPSSSTHILASGTSTWLVVIAVALAALVLLLARHGTAPEYDLPSLAADNAEYLKMAQGHTREVSSPFTRRALYPFLARCLCAGTGLSVTMSFVLLAAASFMLLTYFLARFLILFGLSPWLAAIFVLSPLSLDRIQNCYMPDLFHSSLTVLFFLLIMRKQFLAGLFVLAIAYMARENTLILCLVFGFMAWLRKLYGIALGSGVVILWGTAFGSWAVRQGQPNIHRLPDFLYLGLKMPHQFLKNVLGFRIWTNTLPFGEPFKMIELPSYLRAGDVHTIGLCYPDWGLPMFTLICLLTLFGTGPLIVWHTRRLRLWAEPHPFAIQVVFVYGLLSYFLGTSIGDWIDRLIGYGWPLFWIAVPYILALMQGQQARLYRWSLLSLGLVPWMPVVLGYDRGSSLYFSLLILVIALGIYVLADRPFRNHTITFDPRQPVVP
jgi:hypothetical protein